MAAEKPEIVCITGMYTKQQQNFNGYSHVLEFNHGLRHLTSCTGSGPYQLLGIQHDPGQYYVIRYNWPYHRFNPGGAPEFN